MPRASDGLPPEDSSDFLLFSICRLHLVHDFDKKEFIKRLPHGSLFQTVKEPLLSDK